jgi:hypothetical protein
MTMERPSITSRSPEQPNASARRAAPRQVLTQSLYGLREFLIRAWTLENDSHGRWKRRWIAASGVAFAVVLAFCIGDLSWRAAVMIVATDAMLAMSGDMLDKVLE